MLPEITEALRADLFTEMQGQAERTEGDSTALPEIIEIPAWALRIEQHLTALEAAEHTAAKQPATTEVSVEQATEIESDDENVDDNPQSQLELF